jgi:hypothetical protein
VRGSPLRLNLIGNKKIDFDAEFSIEDETTARIVSVEVKTIALEGIRAGYTRLFAT